MLTHALTWIIQDAHEILEMIEEDQKRLNAHRLEHLVTAPSVMAVGAGTASMIQKQLNRAASL
jgi:hypothetical protein